MRINELINQNYKNLNDNDLYIWAYITHHRNSCERISIDDLADNCHVSRSTILRFCKRIGLKGFTEFKVMLKMDNMSNASNGLVEDIHRSYLEKLQLYKEYNYKDIVETIYNANQLFVYGTGLIQETAASHLKRNFSVLKKLFLEINATDDFDGFINLFEKDDVFVAISFSGENKTVLDYVNRLKAKGVKVISIVAQGDCSLARISDYNLTVGLMPIITHLGRKDDLSGDYFVLIDFLVANYIDYVNNRG